MNFCFERQYVDEFVRVGVSDGEGGYRALILAISSQSTHYPGLFLDESLEIIGVDLI